MIFWKPGMSETYEVQLTTWAYGGEALGRLEDGRAVFVPLALPGERVRVRLTEDKPRYARGEVTALLEAAADRVAPRCPLYGRCGGCHYQHVAYAAQLTAKRAIVRDQLVRIGKFPDPAVAPTVPSPAVWGYRNHIQMHLSPEGRLGFRAPRSAEVVPAEDCLLAAQPLRDLIPHLVLEAGSGVERVHLRVGAGDEVLLWLRGQRPAPPAFQVDFPLSAVYTNPEGAAFVLVGRGFLPMEVKGKVFRVSAASFFQVNLAVAEAMIDHLLEHLPLTPRARLLELYSGVGLFSAFLAPQVGELVAVESSPEACYDFGVNLDAFDHVALYEAPAAMALEHLAAQGFQPDVAVLDPPRSGLSRAALDGLMALAPAMVAYVSCDPATLARDGRRMARHGYRLVHITPFDMFPQTYHIETISLWERRR